MAVVPNLRIRVAAPHPERQDGDYVLYWMTAHRRCSWNFALQRAVEHCERLRKPLLIFEPLRLGYRWASERLHRFAIDGMAEHVATCAAAGVTYLPYLEPLPDAGKGLLAALAERACLVVGDEHPGFFMPRMINAAARVLPLRFEVVDANGILPLRGVDRAFTAAVHFRRFLQGKLPLFLRQMPEALPLARLRGVPLAVVPAAVRKRWPAATPAQLAGQGLDRLLIDHLVGQVAERGGTTAAVARWRIFREHDLAHYGVGRNHPDDDRASGLSPWLHFGHISVHQVVAETLEQAVWSPERLAPRATGAREGWWGIDAASESFLDELITWRELGYGHAYHVADDERYESLPAWARATLDIHAADVRAHRYTLEQLTAGATHDRLWNAAQRQLRESGRMHNYLRMLWGKKILEWTAHPREALAVLFELNNRYALDGRDPNSTSGICWTLGRYDHPWAPERPVFGVVRYMSSDQTLKKLRVKAYLERWGGTAAT